MSTPLWALKGVNYTFKGANKFKNLFNKGTGAKAFTKTKSITKEYAPVVAVGAVLGAGVGSLATTGYNAATGYKNKRVKKKKA
jgi:uncharacterized membrane protein YfcA